MEVENAPNWASQSIFRLEEMEIMKALFYLHWFCSNKQKTSVCKRIKKFCRLLEIWKKSKCRTQKFPPFLGKLPKWWRPAGAVSILHLQQTIWARTAKTFKIFAAKTIWPELRGLRNLYLIHWSCSWAVIVIREKFRKYNYGYVCVGVLQWLIELGVPIRWRDQEIVI